MASRKSLLCLRCSSLDFLPPLMSEVRIVLLGENVPLTNRVGNFILGRSAFETEDHLCSVKLYNERASGHVEGRLITIINTPHLYNPHLSQEDLTQRVKECVSLAGPGPRVFLFVLESELIRHEPKNRDRVRRVLETYSPLCRKRSVVLTTGEDHGFINECEVRHHRIKNISTFNKHEVLQLLEKIDVVMKEMRGIDLQERRHQDHLTGITAETDRVSENLEENKESKATPHWKLVLMGMDGVKASISNVLLGLNASLVQTESTLLCVKQGEMCGHRITVVEMPNLYNTPLSEQEVMNQTLHCVSVCDSGVHAFFITVPEGPLSDEDKAEIKMIQRIFSSRVNDHIIFIINKQSKNEELDSDLQSVINEYGGKYLFYSSTTNTDKLFNCVKDLLKQNGNRQYTVNMYLDAQIETQLKYKREIAEQQKQMDELKNKIYLKMLTDSEQELGRAHQETPFWGEKHIKKCFHLNQLPQLCVRKSQQRSLGDML